MPRPRMPARSKAPKPLIRMLMPPAFGRAPKAIMNQLNPLERVVRPPSGLPDVLCRVGSLEVRLARTTKDIRRAQRLRFKVFFNEMSATPNAFTRIARRDIDPFDRLCDHLLVIDRAGKIDRFGRPKPKVVGTYRLLRSEIAEAHGADFYTAGEFDLSAMLAAHPGARVLELGRSCVAREYRTRRVVDLLWAGLWHYLRHHRIELMFGCASFEGTDPRAFAEPLAFLHHFAVAHENGARALPWRYVDMNLAPKEAVNPRAAMKSLPPLIKGYLRLGAKIGDGAVIDRQFGTTDVLVMLRVADIDPRYIEHYSETGRML